MAYLTPGEEMLHQKEEAATLRLIKKCSDAELTSIEIHAPNPDFSHDSQSNYCVTYKWFDSKITSSCEKDFYGKTLDEALNAVIKFKSERSV